MYQEKIKTLSPHISEIDQLDQGKHDQFSTRLETLISNFLELTKQYFIDNPKITQGLETLSKTFELPGTKINQPFTELRHEFLQCWDNFIQEILITLEDKNNQQKLKKSQNNSTSKIFAFMVILSLLIGLPLAFIIVELQTSSNELPHRENQSFPEDSSLENDAQTEHFLPEKRDKSYDASPDSKFQDFKEIDRLPSP
ncbi:hypothetical protein NIES39_D06030 [Arthrospira platensis NIES-39]|nr:hypothetical protein NIES39_D06030 [Arthrospira platensis NIES-39]